MGEYRIIDHPADLLIRAEGDNLCDLISALINGAYRYSVESRGNCDTTDYTITIEAMDEEELIIGILNELLFYLFEKFFILRGCSMKEEENRSFSIKFNGLSCNGIIFSIEIKSATYHNLRIVKSEKKVTAMVLFDI